MKARDFVYWLQGAIELGGLKEFNEEQTQVMRNHIDMVFIEEIDPSFDASKQDALNSAHNGGHARFTPKC